MSKDDPERAARLAEALRANLRRRKTQARALSGEPGANRLPEDKAPPPSQQGCDEPL